ncbi:MAG: AI-2E family transporter [Chloroflexota bacterium]
MTDAVTSEPQPTITPPDAGGTNLVPGWLMRLAAIGWRVLVTVALAVAILAVVISLTTVTGAILVGLVVTATVYPLVQRLEARGWPRTRAAVAVSVLALIFVVVTIALIIIAFVPYVADLLRLISQGIDTLSSELTALSVPDPVLRALDRAVTDFQAIVLSAISDLVDPIATFVTILILGGFLTFYLLADGDHAWESATSQLDDWRQLELTRRGELALEQFGGYLRGTAVLATVDAFSAFVFLTVLGIPFAGPLAVIVFIGGFIPYLGGIVTVSALALVALATKGALSAAVLLALIAVMNVIEQRYLAPLAYGPHTRIPAALAVVAVPTGAILLGPLGLFAAVPIVVAVVAFLPAIIQSLGTARREEPPGALVPIWLDRLGQWSWRLLVVIGLGWLLVQVVIQPFFTAPVVLALILAATLAPVVEVMRQRGASPTLAAAGVTVASIAIVVALFVLTVASLAQSLPEVVGTTEIGASKLGLGATPSDIVQVFGDGLIGTVTAIVTGALSVTIVLALSILLIFFFLRDGRSWWSRIVARLPENRRDRVDWTGVQAVDILRGTMIGTALTSLAGAILQFLTMAVLGLPLAFPISVLMFFGGFIPYIGSLIVTLIGFLVAVAVGDPIDIVLMGIFTIVFNIVQGNVVAPLVYGKTVSLHPAVVLLAAPAGAAIGGILGMVMIVPILAIMTRTWRTVIHLFDPEGAQAILPPVGVLSTSPPVTPPILGREAVSGAEP